MTMKFCREKGLFNKSCWVSWISIWKKMIDFYFTLYARINSRCVLVLLGCYNKNTINFGIWWGSASSFMDDVLLLWPHLAEEDLSWVLISFRRVQPLWTNHLCNAPPLIPLPWGLRFQHMSSGQNTDIQTIAISDWRDKLKDKTIPF